MNKQLRNIVFITCLVALSFSFQACQEATGNQTGSEYMPDMAHSIAYEANYYNPYFLNTWEEGSVVSRKELVEPKGGVKGTVPRGYAGVYLAQNAQSREEVMETLIGLNSKDGIAVPVNGSAPYYYEDSDSGRVRATEEILYNPFPITEDGLAKGEELYNIFCGVCHGTKGNFNDGIYEKGIYPLAPANLINEEFTSASNGRYYHAIMYGKNAMGAYKDKISYEERWQVIHYIRALQAEEQGLAYNAEENTLNEFAIPIGQVDAIAELTPEMASEEEATEEMDAEGEHSSDEEHGDEDHSTSSGQ